MDFNIKDIAYVQLTDQGRKIIQEKGERFLQDFPCVSKELTEYVRKPKKEDAEGWSKWVLWELMQTFGPSMHNGMDVPFKTTIRIGE